MNILFVCAGWGSWIKPLIKELQSVDDIKVYVINTCGDDSCDIAEAVYNLNLKKSEMQGDLKEKTFAKYDKILRVVNPDIIQVYGTENNFGQLARYVNDIPVVVNIQGILTCCKFYRDSYIYHKEIVKFKSLKNYLGFGGFNLNRQVLHNEKPELDILKNNRYFFGRTYWDHGVLSLCNKNAEYYTGEELLRDTFYKKAGAWDIKNVERHSIFMPAGFNPIKGMHIAIEAVKILKKYYPDIKLYVPGFDSRFIFGSKLWRYFKGEMYTNYLAYLISNYGLQQNVIITGKLPSDKMACYMQKSHVFLSPSVIDNSPNAVGEATMIGIPIVSTYVGGIPSFLENEKSCLFANSGDPYMIALAIDNIFRNDDLAIFLSANAFKIAQNRHNKEKVTKQYVDSFKNIITNFKKL